MTRPSTKASRQAWVAATLADRTVRSQEELARLLSERGVPVTQATLSRDLDELGAVRVRAADGSLVYALPGEPGGPGSPPGLSGPASGPASDPVSGPAGPADPARSGDSGEAGEAGEAGEVAAGAAASGRTAAAGGPRLARVASELLISAEASANMVVLRTPAGAAQFLASVLDHAAWPAILGTVAGDDTVLVIARNPAGGADLAARLLALAERRR